MNTKKLSLLGFGSVITLVIAAFTLFSGFASPVFAAGDQDPGNFFGETGSWSRYSKADQWASISQAFGEDPGNGVLNLSWSCTSSGSTATQAPLGLMASVLIPLASGDNSAANTAAEKYFGINRTTFESRAKSLFSTLKKASTDEDKCKTAADLVNNANIKLKSCDGSLWADACPVGDTAGGGRADLTSKIVAACSPFWSNQDELKSPQISKTRSFYAALLNGLSGSDFNSKVSAVAKNPDDISQTVCGDIYNKAGVEASAKKKIRSDLETTCKGKEVPLSTIASMTKAELGAAWGEIESGCEAALGAAASGPPTTTCVVNGVGWIVCAFANVIAEIVDTVYAVIEIMLRVQPLNTDTSGGNNAVYNVWNSSRNIANVLFVIAFLIIIYSQLTGFGVSNYGIKKLLPKIIIAALMVNISYWICAIAVDLSNIVGSTVTDLFEGVRESMNIAVDLNWQTLVATLLSGATFAVAATGAAGAVVAISAAGAGSAASLAALYLLLPMLLVVIFAVLAAIFVLVARQALIVILIIISPIAFVALLLPNTEKFFGAWRKTFTTMLLLYPAIAIVFGGAQIAGLSIIAAAADGKADGVQQPILIVTGMIVQVIPLAITPFLIKLSGSVGRYAGILKNKGNFLTNAARKAGKQKAGLAFNKVKYSDAGESLANEGFKNNFKKGNRRLIRGAAGSMVGRARKFDMNRAADESAVKMLGAARDGAYNKAVDSDDEFAGRAAGDPGSKKMVNLTQAYAKQKLREEESKDIGAARKKLEDIKVDESFLEGMVDKSKTKEERAAFAVEIAARGEGKLFHQAIAKSQEIDDDDDNTRLTVQRELIGNIREDHLGVSDTLRGDMGVGAVDRNYKITDGSGADKKEHISAGPDGFKNIYEASLDKRLGEKLSPDVLVSLKPHDKTAAKELLTSGRITDDALQRMIDNIAAAKANSVTAVKIKGETEVLFAAAEAEALKRGKTANQPTSTTP